MSQTPTDRDADFIRSVVQPVLDRGYTLNQFLDAMRSVESAPPAPPVDEATLAAASRHFESP